MFVAALFTVARTWKHPRCTLTDEWINKLLAYYLDIKRNTFESVLMRWMNLELLYRVKYVRKRKINIVY